MARGTGEAGSRPAWASSLGVAALGLVFGGVLAFVVGALDAVVVISVALAAAGLVVMIVRPEIAVHVVLFAVYTNVTVVAATTEGPLQQLVAGGILALLAVPLVYHLVIRRQRLRLDAVFGLMLVLLGVFALSAARAMDASTAIARITVYVVEGVAIYFLVVNVVRSVPTLRRVIATLLLAGSVLGGLALYQGATGSFDESFGGLAQSRGAFEVEGGPVGAPDLEGGLVNRAGGPVREPNRFAQMLLVLLPLALFQVKFGRTGLARALGLGAGFLILSGVLLTYSRGAFLTLAALVALCAILGYVRPSRIVVAVVALLVAAPVLAPGIYTRIGTIRGALDVFDPAARGDAEQVARGRTTETLAAVHAFLDHPILGVGPGHYLPHYSVRYQLDPNIGLRYLTVPRRAHNLYAEMAAESGLLGLVTFLSMPLVVLVMLWRRRQALLYHRPDLAYLATGFGLAILGYLGTGVFLHLAFERYYWLLLAVASAACHALTEHMREAEAPSPDLVTYYPATGWRRATDPAWGYAAAEGAERYVPSWGARG